MALVFILAAACCFAGSLFFAKLASSPELGAPLHPLQVSHARFSFAWLAIAATVLVTRFQFGTPDFRLHLFRTALGWVGVSLMFAAVAFIPLSDVSAISFLNPIFAMLLAIPLLGERVGKWRWAAAFIALAGALVLLRPGAGTFQWPALLALGAALVIGLENIAIKMLADREPLFQILFVNNTIGAAIATVAVFFVWSAPTDLQWAALAGVGFSMVLGQFLNMQALRRAEATFVLPFTYATLIYASLFDLIVFAVVPDRVSVLGAAIIVAGGVLLAWREIRKQSST